MMRRLSHIFPLDYPNPPTQEDLLFEVQDLLRHHTPLHILNKIKSLDQSPYYKEALATCYMYYWQELENSRDPIAGYDHPDGYWIPFWPEAKDEIKRLIREFEHQQSDYAYLPIDNSTTTNTPTITQQIKSTALNAAQTVISTIKNQANSTTQTINIQNITINMPVYIVQGGEPGTSIFGNVGTFIGHADKLNLN